MKILKKAAALLCSAAVLLSVFTISFASFAKPAAAAPRQTITLRVEGRRSTIYYGKVNFSNGENLYNIMASAFKKSGIEFKAKEGRYGHEIVSIGGESGAYPVWWHIYQNGKAAPVGVDSLEPKSGDEIVVYLGDDSVVLYPTVTLTPQYPVEGQKATINISASYTDYSGRSSPAVKTERISGATVVFNGVSYKTDKNGDVQLTMPAAGSYMLKAYKENKDATHAIVRTGDIPVTIYAADSVPSSGGSASGGNSRPADKKAQVSPALVREAISSGAKYIRTEGITDWSSAFAYALAGGKVPQSYFDSVAQDLDMGGASLPIHLAGMIIGLKAAGADPRDFNGTDLVAKLCESGDKIGKSGLNGYAYALLALDCGDYRIPDGALISREKLVDKILSYQKPNGAFSLDKSSAADSDMTAIAMCALSPYVNEEKVKSAVDSAVGYLSKVQQADGGFQPAYSSSEVSETTAQVVIALASCGVDPAGDPRFIKNGASPLSALMAYRNPDGGFAHIKNGKSDLIATDQAVMALVAYRRHLSSGRSIYDLTEVESASVKIDNPDTADRSAAPAFTAVLAAAAAAAILKKSAKLEDK